MEKRKEKKKDRVRSSSKNTRILIEKPQDTDKLKQGTTGSDNARNLHLREPQVGSSQHEEIHIHIETPKKEPRERQEKDGEETSSRNDDDNTKTTSAESKCSPTEDSRETQKDKQRKALSELLTVFSQEQINSIFKDKLEREILLNERARKSIYIQRLIRYWSRQRSAILEGSKWVNVAVSEYVHRLAERLPGKFKIGPEQIKGVGSSKEGVKIRAPDEFDFLYILKYENRDRFDDLLEIEHTPPKTFKPRKAENVQPNLYFKIFFTDKCKLPEAWRCVKNENCDSQDTAHSQTCPSLTKEINPRQLQEEFKTVITSVLKATDPDKVQPVVTLSGPAVTITTKLSTESQQQIRQLNKENVLAWMEWFEEWFQMPEDKRDETMENLKQDRFVIKIDLVLAIRVKRNTIKSHLKENDKSLDGIPDNQDLFLVPFGDFWKVTVSLLEKDEMLDLVNSKVGRKDCLTAIKYLRDEMDMDDPLEGSAAILSTYPLKVAFLEKNKENKDKWEFSDLGDRVFDILCHVEKEGRQGTLTHYYFRNEPLLLESDKCYVESRRIRQKLVSMNQTYLHHGRLHTLFLLIFLLCCAALVTRCAFTLAYLAPRLDTSRLEAGSCEVVTDQVSLELSSHLFWHYPMVVAMLLVTCLPWCGALAYRYCWYKKQSLYRLYPCILWFLYPAAIFLASGILATGIGLNVLYVRSNGCRHEFPSLIWQWLLSATTLSAVPLVIALVYLIITFSAMRCLCQNHKYEWIFFDRLFRDCLHDCCCKTCCCYAYCCHQTDRA